MISTAQIDEVMRIAMIPCYDDEYCGALNISGARGRKCKGCAFSRAIDILEQMYQEAYQNEHGEKVEEGCWLCNQHKDILYDSNRGGFKIAEYCPNCGKKIN